jgi:hypothetical protein
VREQRQLHTARCDGDISDLNLNKINPTKNENFHFSTIIKEEGGERVIMQSNDIYEREKKKFSRVVSNYSSCCHTFLSNTPHSSSSCSFFALEIVFSDSRKCIREQKIDK